MAVLPLIIVALTVTVPALGALKVFPLIVAPVFAAFTTLHVIAEFVALLGLTVPERVKFVPAVAVVGTPVMPVTGTCAAVTVIVKSCVKF